MKVTLPPSTLLAPLPAVLVSCSDGQQDNIITIAWVGILSSKPARLYVSVRPERHSFNMIKKTGQFVVNLVPENLVAACDYCGIRSGRDVDKFEEMGFGKVKAQHVDVPLIEQCPINLECKVFQEVESGSHTIFMADILAVNVDQSLMNNGAIDYKKAGFVNYQHGEYYATGKHLARFGFATQRKFIKECGKGVKVDMSKAKYTKRKK